ncbi:uncharacterized protein LOC123915019 [Trifolium pratense]|uniref:uncharacterized protein LOC123915019 n=1 Tax=Trifolium pratense TaxID=57577 RepID=UPI001E694D8F|nr:uncharacterized protein LOC123915019 [Trifolium pratense]
MDTFDKFSKSTGLKVNPAKCCIFFGGVDQSTKNDIKRITRFDEGTLPFRYLGIPMTSKKLAIQNYMGLIDRIVGRITHWSSKLLSYVGRIQLLNSKSRKSPVAWKSVCQPKRYGGLNLIDIEIWNRITMLKLLWNLGSKADNLWEKWVHAYYIKNRQIMEARVPNNASWLMKAIMQQRDDIRHNHEWKEMLNAPKFNMKRCTWQFMIELKW